MKSSLTIACLLLCGIIASGCGSSENATQEETSTESQAPPPSPPPAQTQSPVGVETRTDTIATIHQAIQEPEPAPRAAPSFDGAYCVQVGAFHKAAHATALESLTKDRFHMPTTSQYFEKLSVYRVRVCGFRTIRDALSFKNKITKAYPGEFDDAWVIDRGKER